MKRRLVVMNLLTREKKEPKNVREMPPHNRRRSRHRRVRPNKTTRR
jgi:hypothetical protein